MKLPSFATFASGLVAVATLSCVAAEKEQSQESVTADSLLAKCRVATTCQEVDAVNKQLLQLPAGQANFDCRKCPPHSIIIICCVLLHLLDRVPGGSEQKAE